MTEHDTWLSPMRLATHGDRPALIEAATGTTVSYAELADAVASAAKTYAHSRSLVAIRLGLDAGSIVAYLGARAAGHAVLLLDPTSPEERDHRIREAYRPTYWISPMLSGTAPLAERHTSLPGDPTPLRASEALGLLLTTSGSTGSPKLVRLSDRGVAANASDIAFGLSIAPDDVAITTLPLHYSFGLSVLHSHLFVGASVILNSAAVVSREFWDAVHRYRVSSIAGVPYTYEMLRRIGFDPAQYPSVRVLTQAGGRLPLERIEEFHARASSAGVRFHVMYGQTEATARIAILAAERLPEKLGSVGPALRQGRLEILEPNSAGCGEVVYHGPNVMLGYASNREDLDRGDDQLGRLATGDLGVLDSERHLYIMGRLARIAKVFGTRVDLDDVERRLLPPGVVAIDAGERLGLVGEAATEELSLLQNAVARELGLHRSGITIRHCASLPRTASGKIDYAALREAL
jgi:acyl-CoA synthetase (AMP-forming)/AMP-acid ligase II